MDTNKKAELQTALNSVIAGYKELIADPQKNKHLWERYGYYPACSFCRILGVTKEPCLGAIVAVVCQGCPLHCSNVTSYEAPCTINDQNTCQNLQAALLKGADLKIAEAAQARLDFIIARAKKNNYTII